MPSSSNLHTLGIMEKVIVSITTGSAAVGAIQDLADFNPDTHIQLADAAGFIELKFDFQEVVTPTQFFIWLYDYNTDYNDPPLNNAIVVDSCDDDDGLFTPATDFAAAVIFNNDVGDPIYFPFSTITGSRARRYWRVRWSNVTADFKISQIGFVVTRSISIGNKWPQTDTDQFYTNVIRGEGGRNQYAIVNRNPQRIIPRKWFMSQTANWEALRDAHRDSKGRAIPLVLNEGTDNYLVRFGRDTLPENQSEYQIWHPSITFEQVPYVEDGENY